jgi:hypothetical protein
MYSATPIGGSTASERAGSTRTNTRMGTKFGTEYTFCFRTGMWTRMEPRTHAPHRYRRHHRPLATGYGRP